VGDVLAAKYRIEALLGTGGMGDVYRATNVLLQREVAIKLLHLKHAEDTNLVDRFLREARVANVVRHPNVVDVLDIDKDTDGAPFIVQELLHGEDLAKYLREHGRLTLDEIRTLVVPIIEAVAEAHLHGVIHRDIKPANVFLANQHGTLEGPPSSVTRRAPRSGVRIVPKLLDFGISKLRSADIRATDVGELLGTPAYMAPEVLHGVRDADARTDVWALGVMLFELLAGRRPFVATGPQVFIAIATTDAPPLAKVAQDVDHDVAAIVDRCLRRNVTERFATAAELATALSSALLAASDRAPTMLGPPSSRHAPPSSRHAPPSSRHAPLVPELDLPQTLGGADPTYVDAVPPSVNTTLPSRGSSSEIEATELVPWPRPSGTPMPLPAAPALALAPAPPSARAPASGRAPEPRRPRGSGLELDDARRSHPRPSFGPQQSPPIASAQPPERAPSVEYVWLRSVALLGVIAIAVSGVLMATVGQPGGFAIVRPLVPTAAPSVMLFVQAAATLLAGAVCVSAFRTGMRERRTAGLLPGLAYAAASGALLFVALQLFRAA
jgi:serine/threonine-protein kinase